MMFSGQTLEYFRPNFQGTPSTLPVLCVSVEVLDEQVVAVYEYESSPAEPPHLHDMTRLPPQRPHAASS
jgi:hypothetical protein